MQTISMKGTSSGKCRQIRRNFWRRLSSEESCFGPERDCDVLGWRSQGHELTVELIVVILVLDVGEGIVRLLRVLDCIPLHEIVAVEIGSPPNAIKHESTTIEGNTEFYILTSLDGYNSGRDESLLSLSSEEDDNDGDYCDGVIADEFAVLQAERITFGV
eukprot:62192-Hanusia_phi.AAC.2